VAGDSRDHLDLDSQQRQERVASTFQQLTSQMFDQGKQTTNSSYKTLTRWIQQGVASKILLLG
jgi:hypothetical protein